MSLKALDAASAYQSVLGRNNSLPLGGAGGGGAADAARATAGASFSDVLKSTVGNVSESVSRSDGASVASMNGTMDLIDVVAEVNNAEIVVESVVAVRDRVIQAYQEIIKMPI
ncbi:MAG: flagellar hook-basal body complex protein FliE [Sphingomonadales bacterium]